LPPQELKKKKRKEKPSQTAVKYSFDYSSILLMSLSSFPIYRILKQVPRISASIQGGTSRRIVRSTRRISIWAEEAGNGQGEQIN
jgi:hypothetical protein